MRIGLVLAEKPELAVLIAQVIEFWSNIDKRLNAILASCLRLDIEIATKMLYTVENLSARRAIVRTAVEHVLSPKDNDLFLCALDTTRSSEKCRHAFAHHIWAVPNPDVYENSLLLIDPKLLNFDTAISKDAAATRAIFDPAFEKKPYDWFGKSYLYRKRALEEEVIEADRAYRIVGDLSLLVMNPNIPVADIARAHLSNEPRIRQALDTLSAQRARQSQK